MDTKTIVIIAVVLVVVALAVIILLMERSRKSRRLKEHFGPEYDQLLREQGDPRRAEAVLADREKRVEKFSITQLSAADRQRYTPRNGRMYRSALSTTRRWQ